MKSAVGAPSLALMVRNHRPFSGQSVGQTVTAGIISGLARTRLRISDYQFFFQTDAAIKPGQLWRRACRGARRGRLTFPDPAGYRRRQP